MQRSIQNKSVVIYDSGTFLGVHIAVNLLQKDYKVYLFLTAEPDENSSSQNLKNIYKEYSTDLTRYINFLFNISNEMGLEQRVTSKKKKDLTYEIKVLVDKLINK